MNDTTWTVQNCVVSSIACALLGFIGCIWPMTNIAANTFGDYRLAGQMPFGLLPYVAVIAAAALPWVARARERRRKQGRPTGKNSN